VEALKWAIQDMDRGEDTRALLLQTGKAEGVDAGQGSRLIKSLIAGRTFQKLIN